MRFLKWSHEEALKTLEEFQIREKTYEQAIAAYQKKLAEYAEAGTERKIEELTLDLREKEAEVIKLRERVSTLTTTIENLTPQFLPSSRVLPEERKHLPVRLKKVQG